VYCSILGIANAIKIKSQCNCDIAGIEEKNIIEIQYMAGQINCTERYKRVSMQDLRKSLEEYPPMK
ncbi:MAG: hypothetical protein ACI9A7_001053, partial [Cyclobacteriaceae bacterium]